MVSCTGFTACRNCAAALNFKVWLLKSVTTVKWKLWLCGTIGTHQCRCAVWVCVWNLCIISCNPYVPLFPTRSIPQTQRFKVWWFLSPAVGGERLLDSVVLRELHPVPLHAKSQGRAGPAGGSDGSHWGGGGQFSWGNPAHPQGRW